MDGTVKCGRRKRKSSTGGRDGEEGRRERKKPTTISSSSPSHLHFLSFLFLSHCFLPFPSYSLLSVQSIQWLGRRSVVSPAHSICLCPNSNALFPSLHRRTVQNNGIIVKDGREERKWKGEDKEDRIEGRLKKMRRVVLNRFDG